MVNIQKLKARIVECGMTQTEVASALGLSRKSWYDRMARKKLDSDEMYKLKELLNIDDPTPIFFDEKVT